MRPATRPPLVHVDRDGVIPASFTQQERLQWGRGIEVPNNTVALGLLFTGPMDVDALERALGLLVERHESLRLTFPPGPAGDRIVVTDGRGIRLRRESVEEEAPDRRLGRALDVLAAITAVPFDLTVGPLFRPVLVRLSDTEHVVALLLDKILVDRNSCVILQQDFLALFEQARGGAEAGLPELRLQFADYAAWERNYLQGAALDRLLGYWRTTLDGVDAVPDAGLVDPDAPQGQAPGLAIRTRTIPAPVRDQLDAAARAGGVSLFALLSSALKTVVYARRRRVMDDSAAADVAMFGSMANRNHPALKDIVGYLATYTVFRTDLSGDPTLEELMTREAGTILGALCHQEVPHTLIARAVSPRQFGVLHRFGQVDVPHFLHFDMDDDWYSLFRQRTTLQVRPVRIPVPEIPRGWLRLIARSMPDGLFLQFRFRTDHYSAEWAERFLADYEHLLLRWPRRSGRRLSAVLDPGRVEAA